MSGYAYEESIEAVVSDQPPTFKLRKPLRPITSQAELDIEIDVEHAATLKVSGEPADIIDGVAQARLKLKPGPNPGRIVAANAVGLVTIEKHTVVFDDQKPEMTDKEVVAKRLGETEMLSIRVGASDASGLALTSRFRVSTESGERSGVLRFNKANSSYQGSIEVPVRPDGSPLDIVVELTDMAGNVSEVRLQ